MIEWLNTEIEINFVTWWLMGLIAGVCLWATIQALSDTWTIKPRKCIDNNQLKTSSSTAGVQCFGCRFELSGARECLRCVRRPCLRDNFEEVDG